MKMLEDHNNSFRHEENLIMSDVQTILNEFSQRIDNMSSQLFLTKMNHMDCNKHQLYLANSTMVVSKLGDVSGRFEDMSMLFQKRMETAMSLFSRKLGLISRSIVQFARSKADLQNARHTTHVASTPTNYVCFTVEEKTR